MKANIVFTGGGTAGHVTPNLPLIEILKDEGWNINYIGSANGVEKTIVSAAHIPFHAVKTGKLRRYFSWQNFIDPFKICMGFIQSFFLLGKLKTNIVFSKGGFVAFPVVVAAWLRRIPVIAHESDLSPGLANRLSFPFVNKICLTFDAGKNHFKNQNKIVVTGTPIREQLLTGSRQRGLALCRFHEDKPRILVIGGSLGARNLNKILRTAISKLSRNYQIIHLCGKGKVDEDLLHLESYCQFEYANEELADLFAAADIVISRAGANSIYEILALAKPHILVPLSAKASRGDQIQNARYFQKLGLSEVIEEDSLTVENLSIAIEKIMEQKEQISLKIKALAVQSGALKIIGLIKEQLHVEYPETI